MDKRISDLVRKNFWIKVFSLIFAVIIWAYVVGGRKQNVNFTAGLKIYSLPSGYAISNTIPKKIHIKLRASKISFIRLNKKLCFRINGSSLLGKKNTVVLRSSYLNLPQGVRVINIYPKIIPVILSRITSKYIKVLPVTAGKLEKGVMLKNISVYPAYVLVKGPKDIVNHLSVITTQKINLNKYTANKLFRIGLKNPTKRIKIMYNKRVNVEIFTIK